MLRTPNYDVRTRAFCGPTAMSAITGEPISRIRDVIRQVWGNPRTDAGRAWPVMGLDNKSMIEAMYLLGWGVVEKATSENNLFTRDIFRFGDFLDACGHVGPFIVNVTGHYIAVSHGEACDTATQLPIEIARWRRARRQRWVQHWWRFAPL